ncbi:MULTISPECIES: sensor of ECF-type sigma factor [unclassified Flavobacterium]|uniref:sensor of ECF-type sigma factor n=1 Tax=unclassified Flavobacterium TaxID=196869 RepID=UPI003F914072
MKIIKIIPILLLLTSFTIFGQSDNMKAKKEKINAMKVAYFTTELDLTTKEAQKFWPIYNKFDDAQFDIRHQKMRSYKNQMNELALNKISEKEALNLLDKMEDSDEELYLLRKKFVKDLKEILPAVKILQLRKSEDDFNRKLLHQYRDRAHKK